MSALPTTDNDRGHRSVATQERHASVVYLSPTGHRRLDAQVSTASGGNLSRQANVQPTDKQRTPAGSNFPDDHPTADVQTQPVVGDPIPAAKRTSSPLDAAPQDPIPTSQVNRETQSIPAGGTQLPDGQSLSDAHSTPAVGDSLPAGAAMPSATPRQASRSLLDPILTLASITLDDLEKLRIAQENRYRSLTTHGTSEAGVEWGFGLDDTDPQVAQAGAMVDAIKALEHTGELNLNRLMRKHPLGPWVKAQRGIGDKQAARLLGIIGDPYINAATGQPRTVSQLWAYCGLHTLPARQPTRDAHAVVAGGEYNVAARRRKGEKANWSDDAKKRAWLIAVSCMKAGGPYREVYDARKSATEGRLHAAECVRCGPAGKPAQIGSPWSDGHRHADALRITSKAILRDLWRESRRLHQEVDQ